MYLAENSAVRRSNFVLLFLTLLLAAIAYVGCVSAPALSPLYTKSVLVTDDNIVGRWDMLDQTDGKQTSECCMTITKTGDAYDLQMPDTDEKRIWESALHLAKLGDAIFLDAEGPEVKYSTTTKVAAPMLQVHAIGRIWIEKDSVRAELLNDDWLRDAAKSGSPALSFVEPDNQFVVTATTEQLQAFALKYANDTKAFSTELKLVRHK